MPRLLLAALCLACAAAPPAQAALALPSFGKDDKEESKVAVEFVGVEGALLDNVRALSSLNRLSSSPELNAEMVGRLVQRAPDEARAALKPFGYYESEVST